MAKQILTTSKLRGEFRKQIENINYSNIQAYVAQNMDESDKNFLSKIFEDASSIKWYVDEDHLHYLPFNKATDIEKDEIYNLLHEQKEIAVKKLNANPELAQFTDKILSIPNEDCIFFAKTEQGQYKIALTKWAYAPISQRVDNNVISALINKRKPKTNTTVHLKYTDGEAVVNTLFYIFKDGIRALKTDTSGSCNLLYLPVGTTLDVALDPEMQKDVVALTILEGQTDYTLNFPFYTDAVVKVIDQFNDLCIGKDININSQIYQTDENGAIELKFIKLKSGDDLRVSVPANPDNPESVFKLNRESSANMFTYNINMVYDCNLRIQAVYEDGKPAVNYPIQIETNDNKKYTTDDQGYIHFSDCEIGESIRVVDWENPDNNTAIDLVKGTNEVIINVNKAVEEQVKIGLIDHKEEPIKGGNLEITPYKKSETLLQETDLEGFCYFPKAAFRDKKKVQCKITASGINGSEKERTCKKKFKYSETQSEYIIRIKKRNWRWLWLLLLLLLIPLFLNFEKNITVQTVLDDGTPCTPTEVDLQYTSRYLYKDGKFLVSEPYENTFQTDTEGKATFEDIGFSGYSFVFYMLSRVSVQGVSDCYIQKTEVNPVFHFIFSNRLIEVPMKEELVDVSVKVFDEELETPIVDAKINFKFKRNGKKTSTSSNTRSDGEMQISKVPKCGMIDMISAEKYGYETAEKNDINVRNALGSEPNITLYLKPVKKRIVFFVKNKFTKEPVPDAEVIIIFSDPRTGKNAQEITKTDLDGRGVGFYDDLFVLAKVKLTAECKHFKKGELKGDYTVEDFIKLPDSLRTIYLEPEPYVVNYRNIDSLSLKPIAGVKNMITVNSQDGKSYKDEQISNRNGVFNVEGRQGDEIIIESFGGNFYYDKISQLVFEDDKDIKMKPKEVDLTFRTIDEYDGSLLANCNLDINVNGKSIANPNNSGNGEFSLHLMAMDQLSITSSYNGYVTNNYQIQNENALALFNALQSKRDITMKLTPCEGGGVSSGHFKTVKNSVEEYDMKKTKGAFVFDYFTDTDPDLIEIFDCRKSDISDANRIFQYNEATGSKTESINLSFTNRVITVKVTADSPNWNYKVNCPR